MNELVRAFRGPSGPVLVGCLVAQIGLGCSYFFGVMLKHIVSEFEWSRAQFAGSSVPLLLGYAVGSPLVGALTDRLGARGVMSGAAVLLAGTFVGISEMDALWHFYALSLCMGISLVGLGDIPVAAVTSQWIANGRGLALGFVYTGSNLGGTVIPLLAAWIAGRPGGSWREALVVIAGLVLALILPFTWFAVREPPEAWVPEGEGEIATHASAVGPDALDLSAALRTRSFWLLFAGLVFFYFYYLGVHQHLAAYLSDVGYSDGRAATSFAGAAFVGVAGKLSIGWFADRISHRRAVLLNFALLWLASVLLLFANQPLLLLLFLLAHGFAVAAENVLLPLLVADSFGVDHMAKIYGVLMVALFVGGGLGPVFAGGVFDRTGSYLPAFVAFTLVNGAVLWMMLGVRDERSGRVGPAAERSLHGSA